jgi:hypothetical protein
MCSISTFWPDPLTGGKTPGLNVISFDGNGSPRVADTDGSIIAFATNGVEFNFYGGTKFETPTGTVAYFAVLKGVGFVHLKGDVIVTIKGKEAVEITDDGQIKEIEVPPEGVDTGSINPPFGLAWGEGEEKIKRLLAGANAGCVNTRTEEGKEIVKVEGLKQTGLKDTLFVFKGNKLTAMELHYQAADWDSAKYDDFIRQVKVRISEKFGAGGFLAPVTDDPIDNGCVCWGYKWKKGQGAIDVRTVWCSGSSGHHESVGVRYEFIAP